MFSHGCLSYNEKMKAQHCEKTLCRASLILQYAIIVTSLQILYLEFAEEDM